MEKEYENYFEWLIELEKEADTRRLPLSSTFYGEGWYCYTRSSSWCFGAIGERVICFSNIGVSNSGQGFLTGLLDHIEARAHELKATHLYFENVLNPRLVIWLKNKAFKELSPEGSITPCFSRKLGMRQ